MSVNKCVNMLCDNKSSVTTKRNVILKIHDLFKKDICDRTFSFKFPVDFKCNKTTWKTESRQYLSSAYSCLESMSSFKMTFLKGA